MTDKAISGTDSRKNDRLLPCPFCGGEVFMMQHPKGFWEVEHKWTRDECPIHVVFFDTKEDAVERWNTRAERTCRYIKDPDTWAELCSECGALAIEDWTADYCWACGAKVVS